MSEQEQAATAPTEQTVAAPAPAPKVVKKAETKQEDKYPVKSAGHGKYTVDGVTYETKDQAFEAKRLLLERDALDAELGDIVPEGIKIHDRVLEFRGSVMEVPMNEPYLPDGTINPMYDRAWTYAWAGYNGTDIADRQARGYHIVQYDELKEMVDNGKAPVHYLSLLRRDGQYLVYGDLILMRIPRPLWRQRLREKYQRNINAFKKVEDQNKANADRMHLPVVDTGQSNELTIRL